MTLQNLSKTMNSYSIFTGRRFFAGIVHAAAFIALTLFIPAFLFAGETVSIEVGKKGEAIRQCVETPNLPCEGEKNSVFNESNEKVVLEERNINPSPAGEDYIFKGSGPYIFSAAGSVSTVEISIPPSSIEAVIGGSDGSDETLIVDGGQLRFSSGKDSTNIPAGSFTFMPRVFSSKIDMIWMCVYEADGAANGRQILYDNKTMFIWKKTNDSLTAPPPAFFKGKPDNDFISKNITATKYFSAGKKYRYTVPDKNKLYYFQSGYRWKKGFDAKDMSDEEKELLAGGFMVITAE